MGWLLTVTENKKETQKEEDYYEAGLRLYQRHCASCHGNDKKGSGNFPSIEHINEKYNSDQLKDFLSTGRRMMPSFNFITTEEKEAIIHYVLNLDDEVVKRSFVRQPQPQDEYRNLPYRMTGYYKFLSPEGYPAIAPPWGTLTAIDLNTGEHIWKITIGEYPELTQKGIPPTGTENYGGPVVTAGGLVFIAASKDGKFRAFNKKSGNLVWEYQLPAAGFATPATYQYKGKQYVVIACGGGKLNAKSGDSYIAFSIPDK